ncbi:hypothetical protein RvY_02301 [Ramazzottius varieornatus]|uniref:Uncharacterized protein n=1 Tax=Ramazzottius varieornatus TaxID=947166 RepID=A0A1D1UML3_RAMVA|nr:hypothetical protein RvY_02301 [Ramazzottius varieornatus]
MDKSSLHRSPEVWAVEIVLKFMGSQQNALRILQGKGMGLYAAFGSNLWRTVPVKIMLSSVRLHPCTALIQYVLVGWVNVHHGGVTSGAAEPITCSDVMAAFSKRLGYWRKQLPSWKTMPDKEEVDDDLNDESGEE